MSTPQIRSHENTQYSSPFQVIKAFILYMLKAGLWLGIALVLLELGLRLFVESPPIRYGYDPDWGYYPAEGTFIIWGSEGYGVNYFGEFGEQATLSNSGANIVVLGDSHTESHQVAYTENYVSVAESILIEKGLDYNLRNHGKAYSSVADYIYLAPVIQEIYSPEAVVIQLSVQDFFKHEVYDQNKVNHFAEKEGELNLIHNPPPFNDHWLGKLMQNTVLLVQGTKRQRILFDGEGAAAAVPSGQAASSPVAFEVIDPQLKMLKEAYEGTPVIVVMLPYAPTIQQAQLVSEETEYDQVLGYFDRLGGWHMVDPSPQFLELWTNSGRLPRGFSNSLPGIGHLNPYGHDIVGELLADQIEQVTLDSE